MDIADRRKVTRELAEAIALALSSESEVWTVKPDYDGHGEIISEQLKGLYHLGLHLLWRDYERIEINGAYNFTAQGLSMHLPSSYSGDRQKAEITVARRRPAEVIAKEIRRRLMPQYLHNLEYALKGKEASDKWKANTRDKLAKVRAALEQLGIEKIWYAEDNDGTGRQVQASGFHHLRVENRSDDKVLVEFELLWPPGRRSYQRRSNAAQPPRRA
jgi:hypothetical protein